MKGKWITGQSRPVYENDWTTVSLVDVTLPDGTQLEHHVVTMGGIGAAFVLAHVADRGVLLMWRHRFIADKWTWELPGGRIERGESIASAAAREMLEETGWRPGKLRKLLTYDPMSGSVDGAFHCFYTEAATWEGPASDQNEAADIAWVTLAELREILRKGEMSDGASLTPILWALTFGPLGQT